MRLETKLLAFEIDEKGKNAGFVLKGKEDEAAFGSDFFRLILDDGMRTEIPILSSMQEGKATFADDKIVVTYDSLISEYGDTYNIKFTLTVEIEDGLLKFTPAMTNGTTDIRINECMCPLADFNTLYGEKSKDIIYFL